MGLFDRFLSKPPGSDHLSRGKELLKNKEFSKAIEEFDEAAEAGSDRGKAIFLKCAALECLYLDHPGDGKAPLVEALRIVSAEIDRRKEAWREKSSVSIDVLYYEQGDILLHLTLYEEALQSYIRCVELDPLSGSSYLRIHDLYKKMDRYPEAEKILDDAIREFGEFSRNLRERDMKTDRVHREFLFRKSLYLRFMGKKTEAEQTLKDGYFSEPDTRYDTQYTLFAYTLGRQLISGNPPQIFSVIEKIFPILPYPEDTLTRTLFLEAGYVSMLYPAALEEFNLYLSLSDRRNLTAWSLAAKSFLALRKENEALETIEGILSYYPRDPELQVIRGKCLVSLARYDEAIEAFTSALSEIPSYNAAMNCKGYALSKQGNFQEALALYDRSLRIDPKDTASIRLKASLLAKMGDLEGAVQFLQAHLDQDPKQWVLREYKGHLFYKFQKYPEALDAYEKAGSHNENPILLLSKVHCLIPLQRYDQAGRELYKIEKDMNSGIFSGLLKSPPVTVSEESLKGLSPQMIEVFLDFWRKKGLVMDHLGNHREMMEARENQAVLEKYCSLYYPFLGRDFVFLHRWDYT